MIQTVQRVLATRYVEASARIVEGPIEGYRYTLLRVWRPGTWTVCFVMLNPSTADGDIDDPTIRRCVGFADKWGAGAILVVNLFALRSTSPFLLACTSDPVGPENDLWISNACQRSELIVAAWGAHPHRLKAERVEKVRAFAGDRLKCFGTTADGSPRHPLYLPAATELRFFLRGSG